LNVIDKGGVSQRSIYSDEESDDDEDELFDMYRAKLIDDSRRRRRQSLSSEDDPYSLDNLSSASLPGDEDSSGAPVKECARFHAVAPLMISFLFRWRNSC